MNSFTVVYADEKGGFLKRCAEKLCRAAKEAKGLDLCAVSDAEKAMPYEILIGNTNRAETAKFKEGVTLGPLEYRMGMENGKYVIVGDGLMAVSYGVDRFISEFLSEGARELDGEIIAESRFDGCVERSEGTDLRIITANLMFERWAKASYGEEGFMPNYVRAEAFRILLDAYKPDVLGLQECSPDWHAILADTVESKDWGLVAPGKVDDSNGETILCYNKNTVTFVFGGHIPYPEFAQTSRICSGLFQLKDGTGRKFLFYTTHWSWNRPEVADMEMRFYSETVNKMRAENAYKMYEYYKKRIETEKGYAEKLKKELLERWDKFHDFDISGRNKFIKEMRNTPYITRASVREVAEANNKPVEYNRLAVMAVSVLQLSHWRANVTISNYLIN